MNRLLRLNACDIYVALGCLYYLQGLLYPSGLINQLIQLVMIVWAFAVAIKYIINYKNYPLFLNALSLLILMYAIYGFVFMLLSPDVYITEGAMYKKVSSYVYLQNALNSFLPFFIMYSFAEKGKLTSDRIKAYCIIFLFLFVAIFIRTRNQILIEAALKGIKRDEFTNNTGYMYLGLFPFLYFFKNKVIRYSILAAIFVAIFMCLKRGAILLGLLCFLYFLWQEIKNSEYSRKFIRTILVVGIIVISAIGFISYRLTTSEYFNQRIEQTLSGNSSHRDEIYSRLLEVIVNDESYTHLIFGRGANSTIPLAKNYAHNDWLEVACNNGLIGIALVIAFYIGLFLCIRRRREVVTSDYYHAAMTGWGILILKTLFSMSLLDMEIWQAMIISYVLCENLPDEITQAEEEEVVEA